MIYQGVVSKIKKDTNTFLVGKNGDSSMQPFQFGLCWFRNLRYIDPVEGCRVDTRLLGYIRHVNLDMIWSGASGMVASNLSNYNSFTTAKYLGIQLSYEAPGPWGINDDIGFGYALEMIQASQLKWKHKSSHQ